MVQADGIPADSNVTIEGGHMDRNGLSSFLLGLGVGVGIGMLFAPKSGQETRDILKNKAGEGADFLKQRGTEVKQTAAEWVDKGKEALNRQKENLNDALDAGRQAYRDTMGQQPPPTEGTAI
jgi:gas vesicle protein